MASNTEATPTGAKAARKYTVAMQSAVAKQYPTATAAQLSAVAKQYRAGASLAVACKSAFGVVPVATPKAAASTTAASTTASKPKATARKRSHGTDDKQTASVAAALVAADAGDAKAVAKAGRKVVPSVLLSTIALQHGFAVHDVPIGYVVGRNLGPFRGYPSRAHNGEHNTSAWYIGTDGADAYTDADGTWHPATHTVFEVATLVGHKGSEHPDAFRRIDVQADGSVVVLDDIEYLYECVDALTSADADTRALHKWAHLRTTTKLGIVAAVALAGAVGGTATATDTTLLPPHVADALESAHRDIERVEAEPTAEVVEAAAG